MSADASFFVEQIGRPDHPAVAGDPVACRVLPFTLLSLDEFAIPPPASVVGTFVDVLVAPIPGVVPLLVGRAGTRGQREFCQHAELIFDPVPCPSQRWSWWAVDRDRLDQFRDLWLTYWATGGGYWVASACTEKASRYLRQYSSSRSNAGAACKLRSALLVAGGLGAVTFDDMLLQVFLRTSVREAREIVERSARSRAVAIVEDV